MTHISRILMANEERKRQKKEKAAAPKSSQAAAPPGRPGLMQIAVDVVSRSDIAMQAVQMWKANPAVRKAHASVADLYDVLMEQEERRAARLSGEKKEAK